MLRRCSAIVDILRTIKAFSDLQQSIYQNLLPREGLQKTSGIGKQQCLELVKLDVRDETLRYGQIFEMILEIIGEFRLEAGYAFLGRQVRRQCR